MPVNSFRNNLKQKTQIGLRHSLYAFGAGLFFAAILYSLSTSAPGPCSTTLTSAPASDAIGSDGQILIKGTELSPGDNWIYIYNVTSAIVIANTATPDSSYTITGLAPGIYDIQVDRYDGTNTLYCSETISISVYSYANADGTCTPLNPEGAFGDMYVRWTHNLDLPAGEPAGHYKPEIVNSYISSASDEAPAFSDYEMANDVLAVWTGDTTINEAILNETYIEYSFQTSATLPEASVMHGVGLAVFDSANSNGVYSGLYKIQIQVDDNSGFISPIILHNEITIDNENPTTGADVLHNSVSGDTYYYYNHYQADNVVDLSPNTTYYVRVYFYDQDRNGNHSAATMPNYIVFDDFSLKMGICEDTDSDGIGNDTDVDDDNDGILDVDEEGCSEARYFIGWWHNNPFGDVKQDGFNLSPMTLGTVYWADGNEGADASVVTGQGGDELVGSGITSAFYGSSRTLYNVDQSNLSGAITDNDYVEASFTTTTGFVGTLDRFGMAVGDNSTSEERTFTHTMTLIISDDNFSTADTLFRDYDPLTPSSWYEYDDVDIRSKDYQLQPSTTYKFRVYLYGLPVSNADSMNIDDYQFSAIFCVDSDQDGIADYLDIDADNDGIVDNTEAQATDSYIAPVNTDTDGDGLDDAYDSDCTPCGAVTGVAIVAVDTDSDGTKDFLDTDSDDDGIADTIEGHDTNGDGTVDGSDTPNANTGLSGGSTDADGDGLLDGFDNNTSSSDPTNGGLTAESHPDVQGGTSEQDWREGKDTDMDGVIDDHDIDDDNDGIPDSDECPIYGPELVVNGDFEDGYANWTSDFNRGKNNNGPTAGGCSVQGWVAVSPCASINGICGDYYDYNGSTPTGSTLITDAYGTGANVIPTTTCNSTAGSCLAQSQPDHTTGSGLSVYIDPNDIVGESYWMQTVSVEAGKTYEFSAWIMVIEEDPNLEFKINGTSLTGGINLDRLTGGNDGPDQWQKVSANWSSGVTSGNVIIELVNTSAGCVGNDIRLDDISLRELISDCDMDGDGIPAYLDLDADNDGIPDIVEANGVDTDGDGRVDNNTDTDGDGIADIYDNDDTDGPLVSGCTLGADCDLSGSTSLLLDTNGDGTNDRDGDFDGDEIPNWLDLDSDDDGILDVVEGGGNDANADGFVDDNSTDIDNDGFADSVDGDVGNDGTSENSANALVRTSTDSNSDGQPDGSYTSGDFDGDGRPNFLDIDADDDGIVDNTEAQATDNYIAPSGIDADHDGVDDIYDSNDDAYGGSALIPENTDGEDNYDYLDTDSDGDAELDIIEGHDSDGDGSADSASPAKNGTITGADIDMDGLDDGFDNNTSSTDPTNSSLQPTSHPIADAGTDRDWRYDNSFPVEWLSFTAEWQGYNSLVSWETARELNSDYFEIERKISENGMFEIVGKVNAGGTTEEATSYEFSDQNIATIAANQRIFYRLRQVDFDGAFEYSDIVELTMNQESLELRVFPNPASDLVNIQVQGSFRNEISLSVTSMEGKIVYNGLLNPHKLEEKLNVSRWAKGTYIINIKGANISKQTRLVVR